MAKDRTVFLGDSTEQTSVRAANTANVRSGRVEFVVPQGIRWVLAPVLQFVLKLLQSGGAEIDGSTLVYLSIERPGQSPQYVGQFPYVQFFGKTVSEQGNSLYRESLLQPLGVNPNTGKPWVVRGGESLIFEFKGPDVISYSESGTALQVKVAEEMRS